MRRLFPANAIPRCPVCGVHQERCFCARFLRFGTRTRFVFLQHPQEARKPTNSVKLACRILENASTLAWDRTQVPRFGADAFLLYPSPDALEFTAEELARPCTVVVPDGTWSQASRIASVLTKVAPLPRRVLPMGEGTRWTVRQSDDPTRVSSAQAAAAVLGLAGEIAAAEHLHGAVAEASRQILAMRGMFRDGEGDLPG